MRKILVKNLEEMDFVKGQRAFLIIRSVIDRKLLIGQSHKEGIKEIKVLNRHKKF